MNAIIYVRVSSAEQVEGTSLDTQEAACRDHARRHNLAVTRVFVEQGESAKFADRTQLLALLDFCKNKTNSISTLVIWKIDRLARNVEDHFAIKATLRRYGVSVASVTEPIAADPNGRLLETILAGFAAFDNDVRAMRTVQGLRQKLRDGIYPFKPPLGYLPPKAGRKVQPDRPDPARFDALHEAWRLFATGNYTKAEILRLLQQRGVKSYRGHALSKQAIDKIFTNRYYAGMLRDPWSGEDILGRHVAMVSRAEFARVQRVILGRNRSTPHHRANEAFPVRGLVRCPTCDRAMTAGWVTGRYKRYPYYMCFSKDCSTRTRSYPAKSVHDEFDAFLASMRLPSSRCEGIIDLVREALDADQQADANARKATAIVIVQTKQALTELVSMRSTKLISDAEFVNQREQVSRRLFELESEAESTPAVWLSPTEEEELVDSLEDVTGLWHDTPAEHRDVFKQLLLPSGYTFERLRTASTGLLFRVFSPSGDPESTLVPHTHATLNQLLDEIRRFLGVAELRAESKSTHSEAA